MDVGFQSSDANQQGPKFPYAYEIRARSFSVANGYAFFQIEIIESFYEVRIRETILRGTADTLIPLMIGFDSQAI